MAYTSGRTVKSAARKPAGLTVAKATADARKVVNRVMPGVNTTVDSRLSHDLDTDTPTVITTITFPRGHAARHLAVVNLAAIDEGAEIVDTDSRIAITRKRNATAQDWTSVRIGN